MTIQGRWARAYGGRLLHYFISKTMTLCGKEMLKSITNDRFFTKRCRECESRYKKMQE